MTTNRAIQILDPAHREHYDGIEEVNEACRIGMEALQVTSKLKESLQHNENATAEEILAAVEQVKLERYALEIDITEMVDEDIHGC
jgi:hypothetical protein